MNKLVKVYFTLFALLMSMGVWATDYYVAVFNGTTNTLTFKKTTTSPDNQSSWDVSNTGTNQPWSSEAGNITKVVFEPSFSDARPKSCNSWFKNCTQPTSIEGIEYLNTSEVTDMEAMFSSCSSLTSLDVSGFNTSEVMDMEAMFFGCSNLTSLDVSSFNTSKVTEMKNMFSGCSNLTSLDLSHFNTNYVIDMKNMFSGCSYLKNLCIGSDFTIRNYTDTENMFGGCWNLASGTLRVRGVEPYIGNDIFSVFTNGTLEMDVLTVWQNNEGKFPWKGGTFETFTLKTAYAVLTGNTDGDNTKTLTFKYVKYDEFTPDHETSWNVSGTGTDQPWSSEAGNITKVVFEPSFADARPKSCNSWFRNCTHLTSIEGIEYLNTSDVTDMNNMFHYCSNLTSLDLSGFNTSKVTDMEVMFFNCSNLTSLDLSSFNTANVEDMNNMFYGCSNLTSLDLSSFNTANVEDMNYMFYGCSNLTSLDLSSFNTSKVTNMTSMFNDCNNLTSLDLSSFNTSNVTRMERMFYGCSSLTSLDLSSFNTSNVSDMSSMFENCSSLMSLDVSSFNTSNVSDMSSMFENCSSLTSLDVSSFNTDKVTTMSRMFYLCSKLASLNIGSGFIVHEYTESSNLSGKTFTIGMFMNCYALGKGTLTVTSTTDPTAPTPPSIHETQNIFDGAFNDATLITALEPEVLGMEVPTEGLYAWKGGQFSSVGQGTAYAVLTDNTDGNNTKTLTFKYGVFTPDNQSSWDVSYTGLTPSWYSQRGNITQVVFEPSFTDARPKSCSHWFRECKKLTTIEGIEYLNTSEVTTMVRMFESCSNLTSLDVSGFNTSEVTDMNNMFYNCNKLTSLDVSGFNTSEVTDMNNMFYNCNKLTSLDVSSFNTSKVTKMFNMFEYCSSLTSLDLSSFNTANVERMDYMFFGCSNLTSLDLSSFNTSNVTEMTSMFSSCSGLTSLNLSSFNTSKVTSMQAMFRGCSSLTSLDLSTFNTNQVKSMSFMFEDCSSLTSLSIGTDFKVGSETNTDFYFSGCKLTGGTLIVMGTTAPTIEKDIFEDVFIIGTLITNINLGATQSEGIYTWKGGRFHYVGSESMEYLDDKGEKKTVYGVLPITAVCTELPSGWYYVEGNVFLCHQLTFTGDAKLILCDGATLTINSTENGIVKNDDSILFSIYAQSSGSSMGKLEVNAKNAIDFNQVAIYGGQVTAKGINGIKAATNVTIKGGQVTANGTNGIKADDIILDWKQTSDYICSSSFKGDVQIVDGKSFDCGGQPISGTITDNSQINKKTLIPASTFAGGNNFVAISSDNGCWKITDSDTKVYVPTGRIVKNGDAYEMELEEMMGSGIPAGVPVILGNASGVPASVPVVGASDDETNTIWDNYQTANPSPAFFVSDGTKKLDDLIKGALGTEAKPKDYIAFTLIDGQLVAASNSGNNVKAGICIFVFSKFDVLQMIRGTYNPPATSAPQRGIPFNFGDDATSINEELNVKSEEPADWYTITGVKLNSKPTQKGVYISGGKKVMVK